ncbi:hypothetical protein BU26DRAFT_570358 [Trematosphaeria pertusa]|uniref:Uncharacterized protein n=1 Tax=Trematosphaeria pertusa TaxID=390896 RepID=A0A6A6I046_9PLEO|nr:uncharacterized protein BU26DRAFT_570358 [Trematosphaeria pertusa]KAF2242940.1 hypothetical protein BU26DRAFT_570358 [Trematosphaeria pertusa]
MPGTLTQTPQRGCSDAPTTLFQPAPRYATASETSSRHLIDSDVHGTRKRSRYDGYFDTPSSASHTLAADPWTDNSLDYSRSSNVRSPPPLANDRYELAGGTESMDKFVRQNGIYDDYDQLEKQRGMWSTAATPSCGLQDQFQSVGMQSTPNGTKPWMLNQIMSIVGGVAGKLIHFCAVPFRGFQAGGGQAYPFEANGEVAAKLGLQDDPFIDQSTGPIKLAPPGNYPEDDYGVLSIESLENERPRMSKRLRTGENWVMVDKDGAMESRPASPRLSERRVPNHARSPSQIPRPLSRAGASTPVPKRPSLIPVSRRSTLDRKALHGASKAPTTGTYSTPRCYSRQSYGSPVMFENKTDKNKSNSPLPAESQRLINKMRREKLEDDARMRRMSSQMNTLLREAREALGSKFEVEVEYMDDGANDGDSYSGQTDLYRR